MSVDAQITDSNPAGSTELEEGPGSAKALEFGSDLVVGMLKTFGIEYIALNPGASFRYIHDSLLSWGGNQVPETILCTHEEVAVAIAHGYAASSGKPMAAIVHNVVGLQHASIAIYQAWQDRVPVLVLGGTGPMDAAKRWQTEWGHTALIQGTFVRDFTKWDDQPSSVESIPTSFVRGYRVATSAPEGPVYLCYDVTVQEDPVGPHVALPDLRNYPAPSRLQADNSVLEDLADRLIDAHAPVLIAEYAGQFPGAAEALTALADLIGAPILGRPGRFNVPSNHPLHLSDGGADLIDSADVILAAEVRDLHGFLAKAGGQSHSTSTKAKEPIAAPDATDVEAPRLRPRAWLADLTIGDVGIRAWSQNFRDLPAVDCEIRADAGMALPRLLELCRDRMTDESVASARVRRDVMSSRTRALRAKQLARAESTSTSRPIALAHVALSLRRALEPHPWVVTTSMVRYDWLWRLLDVERADQWAGINFGGGLGNRLGFGLGVALDRRNEDVVCVGVLGDGDILYTSSALWTAAHHRLPLLVVVLNNRSYHGTAIHALQAAKHHRRSPDIGIGQRLVDPSTDFAALARSFGVAAEGPIEDPDELLPALERALRIVRDDRRPALVDIVCAGGDDETHAAVFPS